MISVLDCIVSSHHCCRIQQLESKDQDISVARIQFVNWLPELESYSPPISEVRKGPVFLIELAAPFQESLKFHYPF